MRSPRSDPFALPTLLLKDLTPSLAGWTVVSAPHRPPSPAVDRITFKDDMLTTGADPSDSNIYSILFDGLASFLIDFATQRVVVSTLCDIEAGTLRHLLSDQIAPRILAHSGELVLHAAGVATPHGTLLIIGRSGSGKSTLAASLHETAGELLGDDAMMVRVDAGRASAHEVYRSLRLFPDSIGAVLGGSAQISPVAEYTAKQNVHFTERDRLVDVSPVQAAVIIDPSSADKLTLTPMTSAQACMAFFEHSFWLDPSNLELTKQRVGQAAAFATTVPAFELSYRKDFAELPEIATALQLLVAQRTCA